MTLFNFMKPVSILFMLVFTILLAANIRAEGLEINNIEVRADYDEAYAYRIEYYRERANYAPVPVTNNTKINVEVFPGSNVTFTITQANTFRGDSFKLRKAFVRVTLKDIDDGADLDQESDTIDLNPGDEQRVDIKFAIPLNANSATYKVVLEAQGEDKNATLYTAQVNLKLEVKKQSHDIRIIKTLLNPSILDCSRKAKITAEIMNVGLNLENEVTLEFKNPNLGINSFDKDISLESSNDASAEQKQYTKTLNIEIPSFLKSGKYPILVNLYWKNLVLFDQKNLDLIVKDCKTQNKTQPKGGKKNETESINVTNPKEEKTGENQVNQNGPIISTKEISIFNSPVLLSAVSGVIVMLVFTFLILGVYLKKNINR